VPPLRRTIGKAGHDGPVNKRLAAARVGPPHQAARAWKHLSPSAICLPDAGCYACVMTARTAIQPFPPVPRRRNRAEAGFTLLEILVVIAILGLLIGLVAPAALRQLGGARISVARQSIERIGSILDLYKLDIGSYPTTEQGLAALVDRPTGVNNAWNGPYVKGGAPLDPWNHPYSYRNPSSRAGHDYDLCSAGPSGTASGGDAICNP
jgi:general secretion pathway protein G